MPIGGKVDHVHFLETSGRNPSSLLAIYKAMPSWQSFSSVKTSNVKLFIQIKRIQTMWDSLGRDILTA